MSSKKKLAAVVSKDESGVQTQEVECQPIVDCVRKLKELGHSARDIECLLTNAAIALAMRRGEPRDVFISRTRAMWGVVEKQYEVLTELDKHQTAPWRLTARAAS